LLDNVSLSNCEAHLEQCVLIRVVVIFLLKQLFIRLNLWLGRR
jgi:hypothetical protein